MSVADIAQGLGIVATLVAGAWALLGLAGRQYDQRLRAQFAAQERVHEERFASQEKSRDENGRLLDARLARIEQAQEDRLTKIESNQTRHERELLEFKLEVSETRVHRGDYVRNQTVIEAKLDGLAKSIENYILRMRRTDGDPK